VAGDHLAEAVAEVAVAPDNITSFMGIEKWLFGNLRGNDSCIRDPSLRSG
jgi:hypothetical protein